MNRNKILDDISNALGTVLAGVFALAGVSQEKPKAKAPKLHVAKSARKIVKKLPATKWTSRPVSKTAAMMRVLADGKPHSAEELGLAGGTTGAHVHTHLAARLKAGIIKKPEPGIFQLNGKKAKKAA